MNQEIIRQLGVVTPEEEAILAGRREIDRTLYMERPDMVVDSGNRLQP